MGAAALRRHQVPGLYRIHEPPDEEQWGRMNADLRALGLRESVSSRDDLNRVARASDGKPMAYSVHLAMLRNLKRAVYSSTLQEHFGLAMECYTHFTPPIRRYPDLVVHRLQGDQASRWVMAPAWHLRKEVLAAMLENEFRARGTRQGSRFRPPEE